MMDLRIRNIRFDVAYFLHEQGEHHPLPLTRAVWSSTAGLSISGKLLNGSTHSGSRSLPNPVMKLLVVSTCAFAALVSYSTALEEIIVDNVDLASEDKVGT